MFFSFAGYDSLSLEHKRHSRDLQTDLHGLHSSHAVHLCSWIFVPKHFRYLAQGYSYTTLKSNQRVFTQSQVEEAPTAVADRLLQLRVQTEVSAL